MNLNIKRDLIFPRQLPEYEVLKLRDLKIISNGTHKAIERDKENGKLKQWK
jgi:hypothetical protein